MAKIKKVVLLIILTFSIPSARLPTPIPSLHDTVFFGKITTALLCPDTSATIYYTTDGTNPGIRSPFSPKSWKIVFDSSVTLKAIAIKKIGPGQFDSSSMITVHYSKKLGIPFSDPYPLIFKDSIVIDLRPPERGAEIHYTLDGTTPDANSTVYIKPLIFKATVTLKYMATKQDRIASDIRTRNFVKE